MHNINLIDNCYRNASKSKLVSKGLKFELEPTIGTTIKNFKICVILIYKNFQYKNCRSFT